MVRFTVDPDNIDEIKNITDVSSIENSSDTQKLENTVENIESKKSKVDSVIKKPDVKDIKDIKSKEKKNEKKDTKEKDEKLISERIHTDWIKDYVRFMASQESPPIYHKWVAIAILAAAMDRDVVIERGYKSATVYPNLYIILVSKAGRSKKSTCARIGTSDFLSKVRKARIARGKATPKGLIEYLNLAKGKTDEKTGKTYRNCSAFIFASELSDFLKDVSYNSGLMELLTDLYDCPDPYEDITKFGIVKKEETLQVPCTCLNFFGCSTPEWLAKSFDEDSFGGGMMSRIIFVYSEETNKSKFSAWMKLDESVQGMYLTLVSDLQKIGELRGAFTVTHDAEVFYDALYRAYEGDFSGRMAGFHERKLTHVLKLAMVMSVNESCNLILERRHIEQALKVLSEVELEMPKAFVYINTTNEGKVGQRILEYMKEHKGIAYRKELVRTFMNEVRNSNELDSIIQTLIDAHILQVSPNSKRDDLLYVYTNIYKAEQIKLRKESGKEKDKDKIKNKETKTRE